MRFVTPIFAAALFLSLSMSLAQAQAQIQDQAQVCPAVPDQTQVFEKLLAQVKVAPDAPAARQITNEMWKIWTTAPDARAQDMLDRGLNYFSQMNLDAAAEAFNELVQYCPDYAEGYNQRAFVRFIRRDYSDALVDLDEALVRSPEHIAALSGKALTLFGLGRMDEGQRVLRRAVEMNPWLPERGMLAVPSGRDL